MQVHRVHILELAEKVAIVGDEIGLEILEHIRQFLRRLFEEHVELAGVVAILQLLIGHVEFLLGISRQFIPVEREAHLAIVKLGLKVFRRTIALWIPLDSFQFYSPRFKHLVEMFYQIREL
jgi:hypothetical protein